jgi:hypothetical protein
MKFYRKTERDHLDDLDIDGGGHLCYDSSV